MLLANIVGSVAGFGTTLLLWPQVYTIWRYKKTEGVSIYTYIIQLGVAGLWIWYGFMIDAWPMIVADIVLLIASLFILWGCVRFGYKPTASHDKDECSHCGEQVVRKDNHREQVYGTSQSRATQTHLYA